MCWRLVTRTRVWRSSGQQSKTTIDLRFCPTKEDTYAHRHPNQPTGMKAPRLHVTFTAVFLFTATLSADDAELLAGKWSVKKVNDEGQKYTQFVEINQGKFDFQIAGEDDQVGFVAKGDIKLEKLGPFKAARFVHIKTGQSTSDLEDSDEEYVSIYRLDGDTWMLASYFDKEREQKPALEVYQRVKSSTSQTLVIDEIAMADVPQGTTWFVCFDLKTPDGASHRYHVDGKEYDKKQVTIPVALEVPKVGAGKKCTFTLQLDDIDDDACGDEPDNRSTGEFIVSERGSQPYKPEDNWRYTIRWHLK